MMRSTVVVHLVFALALALANITVECNHEVDILYAWRVELTDPYNVLQSWDPTLTNPCTWFHVSCNSENRVTRVDLGDAGLSGPLVPQLGSLTHLQYLQVEMNRISGTIPSQLGNLSNLISLSLYANRPSGPIPASLGNLRSLRFMNLNSNNLTGHIPETVIQLVQWGNLRTLNVSQNMLAGTIGHNSTLGFRMATIIQDPKA